MIFIQESNASTPTGETEEARRTSKQKKRPKRRKKFHSGINDAISNVDNEQNDGFDLELILNEMTDLDTLLNSNDIDSLVNQFNLDKSNNNIQLIEEML